MDCSLPGSSIHGISRQEFLESITISFSRASSQPRDQTLVSHTAGRRFTICATRGPAVIQAYAPTTNAEEAEVVCLYEDLKDTLELSPEKDILFIIGNWNAKVDLF